MKYKIIFFGVLLLAVLSSAYSQQDEYSGEYDDENDFIVETYSRPEMYNLFGRYARIILYKGNNKDVKIPLKIKGALVAEIGESAFAFKELTSVIIPDSVTFIGQFAFEANQLTEIILPPNLKSIEEGTFANNQLTEAVIPNKVTHIGDSAFKDNQLTNVIISDMVNFIGEFAFAINYQLTEITIPKNVAIERYSFENDFLTFYARRGRRAGTYSFIRNSWGVRTIYQ